MLDLLLDFTPTAPGTAGWLIPGRSGVMARVGGWLFPALRRLWLMTPCFAAEPGRSGWLQARRGALRYAAVSMERKEPLGVGRCRRDEQSPSPLCGDAAAAERESRAQLCS